LLMLDNDQSDNSAGNTLPEPDTTP
jgi:hypothetical protein